VAARIFLIPCLPVESSPGRERPPETIPSRHTDVARRYGLSYRPGSSPDDRPFGTCRYRQLGATFLTMESTYEPELAEPEQAESDAPTLQSSGVGRGRRRLRRGRRVRLMAASVFGPAPSRSSSTSGATSSARSCYLGDAVLDQAIEQFPQPARRSRSATKLPAEPGVPARRGDPVTRLPAHHHGCQPTRSRPRTPQLASRGAQAGTGHRSPTSMMINTRDAHRIIHFAKAAGREHDMVDAAVPGRVHRRAEPRRPRGARRPRGELGLSRDGAAAALARRRLRRRHSGRPGPGPAVRHLRGAVLRVRQQAGRLGRPIGRDFPPGARPVVAGPRRPAA